MLQDCRYVLALGSLFSSSFNSTTDFLKKKTPPTLYSATPTSLFLLFNVISSGQFLSSFTFLTVKEKLKLLDLLL